MISERILVDTAKRLVALFKWTIAGAVLMALLAVTGCAHVASTRGTFSQEPGAPLILRIERHMDTIVRGPDIEEDQHLVLELRRVEIGKRLAIPSEAVTAQFDVDRFGPSSYGNSYRGYVIVRSVSKKQVVATLKLDIIALTTDGSYKQTPRFHGDYTFNRESAND